MHERLTFYEWLLEVAVNRFQTINNELNFDRLCFVHEWFKGFTHSLLIPSGM